MIRGTDRTSPTPTLCSCTWRLALSSCGCALTASCPSDFVDLKNPASGFFCLFCVPPLWLLSCQNSLSVPCSMWSLDARLPLQLLCLPLRGTPKIKTCFLSRKSSCKGVLGSRCCSCERSAMCLRGRDGRLKEPEAHICGDAGGVRAVAVAGGVSQRGGHPGAGGAGQEGAQAPAHGHVLRQAHSHFHRVRLPSLQRVSTQCLSALVSHCDGC